MNTEEAYKAMRHLSNRWHDLSEYRYKEPDHDEKLSEARENDFNFRKKMASKSRRKRK